ncbi:MAG: zinc-dependent metalloprotease [Actinomycetes bacterium]
MSSGSGFGFGQGDGGDEPFDPSSFDLSKLDMNQLGEALQQFGAMLSSSGGGDDGPVSWETAERVAREALAAAGDPAPDAGDRARIADAVRLAEHWLDEHTAFPAIATEPEAWSRSEWLVATLPVWKRIIEPVAASVSSAMGTILPTDSPELPDGIPPELASMMGPLLGMAKRMGSMMFGMQVGQGLATLATEVLGAGDVGVPLVDDGPHANRAALLPLNVEAFGEGLGVPDDDVRLYLALREAAQQRLFAGVPWLRARLIGAVEEYARGVHVDQSLIEEAMRDVDPNNPEALQEVLSSGVFEPTTTPEQQAALARLEILLALVEGWVDAVVAAAAAPRMPSADALRETVRRRRAIGGPAEKTFATLVGLEMRPRRLREAATLWEMAGSELGPDERDALWEHPDLLPTSDDLEHPAAFLSRSTVLDLGTIEAELGEDLDGDGTVGPVQS